MKMLDNFLASIDVSVQWVRIMKMGNEMDGKSKRVRRFFKDRKPGASLVPVLAVAHFGAEGNAGTGGESSDDVWIPKSEQVFYDKNKYPKVFITISWEEKHDAQGKAVKFRGLKLAWSAPVATDNLSIDYGYNSITFGKITVTAAGWFAGASLPEGVEMTAKIAGLPNQPPSEPSALWWDIKDSVGFAITDDSINLDFTETMSTVTPHTTLAPWHVTLTKP